MERGTWVNPIAGKVTLREYSTKWLEQRPDLTRGSSRPTSPGNTMVAKCYRLLHAILNTAVADERR